MSDRKAAPTPAPSKPDPGLDGNRDQHAERTLDGPIVGGNGGALGFSTDCQPATCQLGDKRTMWAGHPNLECPLCGYATIDMDAARARNPRLQKEG